MAARKKTANKNKPAEKPAKEIKDENIQEQEQEQEIKAPIVEEVKPVKQEKPKFDRSFLR